MVRLSHGPLDNLQREVSEGATSLEVPFIIADGGFREIKQNEKPTGYWVYTQTSVGSWVFSAVKDTPEVRQAKAKSLQEYCEVDEPGIYVLDNGDVIELMRDHSGYYYGMFRGLLCTIEPTENRRAHRVVTVKHSSSCGVIVDKGEWGPASIDDLKRVPMAARFGDSKTLGTLVGARFENGAWLWLSSDGRQVDVCETVKCLSELPF